MAVDVSVVVVVGVVVVVVVGVVEGVVGCGLVTVSLGLVVVVADVVGVVVVVCVVVGVEVSQSSVDDDTVFTRSLSAPGTKAFAYRVCSVDASKSINCSVINDSLVPGRPKTQRVTAALLYNALSSSLLKASTTVDSRSRCT